MTQHYDAIIIGAGQAGFPLAGKLAGELGWHTALIEKDKLGGTCVNYGCTPSKTLIASARAAHIARRGADFGVVIPGEIQINWETVQARRRKVVGSSRDGLNEWLGGLDKLDIIRGEARFTGPHEIDVNGQTLSSEKIFINTGAHPHIPDIDGVQDVPFLTNESLLEIDAIPEHLIIIGGSYIGLELGQAFRRFGSQVTIVEMSDRLIKREDPEISEAVRGIMEAEGIGIRTNAECISLSQGADGQIVAGLDCAEPEKQVIGSHVLLATGRRPNSDIGLDAAGLEVDKRNQIVINDKLETSVPGVWALGDVNGHGAFTHTSVNDWEVLDNILFGDGTARVDDRIMTYALYIDPPLGRVGLTETQARDQGYEVLTASKPMSSVSRAIEMDETEGLMKFVVDAKTQRFLGAAILGIKGDEIVGSVTNLMYADAPYTVFANAMHPHPTVTELIPYTLRELS
ncbi:MAG: FAD-containing oxidoreductase [Anaerolineales bacterium]